MANEVEDLKRRVTLLLNELESITAYAKYSMMRQGPPDWVEFENKIIVAEEVIRIYKPESKMPRDITPCKICGWIDGQHNDMIHAANPNIEGPTNS